MVRKDVVALAAVALAFGAGLVVGSADQATRMQAQRGRAPSAPVLRVILTDPDRKTRDLTAVPSNPGDLSAQPSGTWVIGIVREPDTVEAIVARE